MILLAIIIQAILTLALDSLCHAFQNNHYATIRHHHYNYCNPSLNNVVTTCCSALQSSTDPLQDLEILDIEEGSGEVAKFDSIVTIKYTGRFFQTGKQFDESMISFKLGNGKVLEGCDKGIREMRVGGKRILKIPSELGFGEAGFSGLDYSIPSNTDLEYTVQLTSVASGPMAEAAANMGIGLDPNTVYLK